MVALSAPQAADMFPELASAAGPTIVQTLPLTQIDLNPRPPRQHGDPDRLQELKTSIATHGVLEPILVRPAGARYQILAGERRYRAAVAAGLTAIPAIIRADVDEAEAAIITAIENLQRQDLAIADEARQFQQLVVLTGLSQRALAERLGKSHNYVNRRLRLLDRPALLTAVQAGAVKQEDALAQLYGERAPADLPGPPAADGPLSHAETATGHPASALAPGESTVRPRRRYLEEAYRPLKRIARQVERHTIPPAERGEWCQQLRACQAYIETLIQMLTTEEEPTHPPRAV